MNFDADQRLPISEAIIELTNSLGSSSLVQNRPHGGDLKIINMIFCEKYKHILPSHDNRPLYVTTYVHDVELKLPWSIQAPLQTSCICQHSR